MYTYFLQLKKKKNYSGSGATLDPSPPPPLQSGPLARGAGAGHRRRLADQSARGGNGAEGKRHQGGLPGREWLRGRFLKSGFF